MKQQENRSSIGSFIIALFTQAGRTATQKNARGFTIVELLIVIVIIGILAAITIVAYNGIQQRARDTSVRNAASALAQAVSLWSVNTGLSPTQSGADWGSTGPISGGACPPGSTSDGGGFIATGVYACTLEELLAVKNYLPANFTASLPPNLGYYSQGAYTLMFYRCYGGQPSNNYVIYYSLESPSADETTNYNNVTSMCGMGTSLNTYGMKAAKQFSTSN